jgi:dGTPase
MFRYRFSSHFINHLVYSLLEYSKNKVTSTEVLAAAIPSSQAVPIGFDPELETEIKKLKKILFQELYQHKDIVRKMFSGKQAIIGLYKALSSEPKLLPKFFYLQLDSRKKHRVIADYIASMSDRYAMKLHHELYGGII